MLIFLRLSKIKKVNKISSLLVVFIILATSFSAHAATTEQFEDATIQQDLLIQNQQKTTEFNIRQRDIEVLEKEKDDGKRCILLNKIIVLNSKVLSQEDRENLTKPVAGRCLDVQMLKESVSSINEYYRKKGYVFARITLPKQDVAADGVLKFKILGEEIAKKTPKKKAIEIPKGAKKILEIEVKKGKVMKSKFTENGFFDRLRNFLTFGKIDEEIDLETIKQGVFQMNRLKSNNAELQVEEDQKNGKKRIVVSNKKSFPARFYAGQDNLGNRKTGIRRSKIIGGFDNLLSLNDNVNLSYTTNLNDPHAEKNFNSFSGDISLPFGYNTISLFYAMGDSRRVSGSSVIKGYSNKKTVAIDRLLKRSNNLNANLLFDLTSKESLGYVDGDKVTSSERQLTIATIGTKINYAFDGNTRLYLKPTYSRGFDALRARQGQEASDKNDPKLKFGVLRLNASLSKKTHIPYFGVLADISSDFTGQIAQDALYGSEQIAIGGYYSVRGYRDNYLFGNNGYYLRNKAKFNANSLLGGFFDVQEFRKYLANVTLEPFFDYGNIDSKFSNSSGVMSGTGLVTSYDSRYLTASLTYSQSLIASHFAYESSEKEDKTVYFEIGVKCC